MECGMYRVDQKESYYQIINKIIVLNLTNKINLLLN